MGDLLLAKCEKPLMGFSFFPLSIGGSHSRPACCALAANDSWLLGAVTSTPAPAPRPLSTEGKELWWQEERTWNWMVFKVPSKPGCLQFCEPAASKYRERLKLWQSPARGSPIQGSHSR